MNESTKNKLKLICTSISKEILELIGLDIGIHIHGTYISFEISFFLIIRSTQTNCESYCNTVIESITDK